MPISEFQENSGFFKRIGKKLWRYACRQKKCLLICVAIFFIFFILNRYNLSPKENKGANQSPDRATEAFIEETAELTPPLANGTLDLFAASILAVQVSDNFSPDYESEEQDAAFIDDNGLLSPGASLSGYFSNMKKEVSTYIVKSGDSPFSIAVKFNINTDTILAANGLNENSTIKPGQKLIILPINGVRVKIAKKDTVAALAKKYSGKENEIRAFNNVYDDKKLVAGDFIIIPNGEMPVVKSTPRISAPKYTRETLQPGSWLIAPTTGKDWNRIHGNNAIDIANACGTPIYAAAAGTIITADSVGWNFGYGKYIMIRHPNGVVTVYGHASQILVEAGQEVEQGQLIMLMGTTGRSTGCHLHFEVRGARNPMAR